MDKSKVAIVRCDSYNYDEVLKAVKQGISLLGGADQFVKKGEKVLLKPNVLAGDLPEKGCTTHPSVFKAVGEVFKEHNLSYGDSPGFGAFEAQMKKCGITEAADQIGMSVADFAEGRQINFEESPFTKKFFLANGVLDADSIINICKMKVHMYEKVTGAVKNLFGCIPGVLKAEYHVKVPSPFDFAKMLVSLNLYLKPRLHIMDGIMAMEGNGPRGGNMVNMKVLLFSNDPVALDTVMCKLMNLDPSLVPVLTYGKEFGLGNFQDSEIELLGDALEPLVKKDFDVIREPLQEIVKVPGVVTFIKNIFAQRPVIDKKKCVKCGVCIKVCPVKPDALNWKKGDKKQPPVYTYKNCIRCFCCQELCPEHVITLKRPLLGRIFFKGR